MKHAEIIQSGLCRTRGLPGIHRPAPSLFFYPGLNSCPIYPSNFNPQFQHISKILNENLHVIRDEYHTLRSTVKNDYKLVTDEHTLHQGDWNWNSYILKGSRQSSFAINCPRTVEILESFEQPKLMTEVPFSYTFFSTLGKQSSIAAHYGPCNLRVRCHFAIYVPSIDDGGTNESDICGMEIGGLKVKWQEGECVFFDDTYEHSVWNKTDSERVVLLFDLWSVFMMMYLFI